MFTVGIEQLIHLRGGINEDAGRWFAGRRARREELADGVSFAALEQKYAEAARKARGTTTTASRIFSNDTLKRLCPPIEFVGVGSSREAYACFGGKCLKLAITPAGRAQNKAEMETAGPHVLKKDYGCFSQVYAIGAGGWLLLTECCSIADDSDRLARDLGLLSWRSMTAMMRAVQRIGLKFSASEAAQLMAKYSEPNAGEDQQSWSRSVLDAAEDAQTIADAIRAGKTGEKHEVLGQLFDFWNKYGTQKLLPFDLADASNWGYTIRNDKISPVVIDAGFSGEVAEKYYK